MSTFAEEVQEINLDGFQVVGGELFRASFRPSMPTVTIWPDRMTFSKASIIMLHKCERVRLSINIKTKCMLATPVSERDADGVRWLKTNTPGAQNFDQITRQITCPEFTGSLYKMWGWNNEYIYRAPGRLVTVSKQVMMLFDFNKAESWKSVSKKDNGNG